MTTGSSAIDDLRSAVRHCGALLPRGVVDMFDLDAVCLSAVFEIAAQFECSDPALVSQFMPGRVAALLFYQPSTRTRLNFDSAAQRLGMRTIGFSDPATTRAGDSYRETLDDVVRFTAEIADVLVLRHPETGAASRAQALSRAPLISAGDGYGQHPTQALGDIWTMIRCLGDLSTRSIGMLGNANIRSLKAITIGLSTLGVGELVYLQPPGLPFPQLLSDTLDARGVRYRFVDHVGALLRDCDLVETIGVNHPNHESGFDAASARHTGDPSWYRIDRAALERAGAPWILHPGPRTDDVDTEIDGMPAATYFTQARNGMWVRMALLSALVTRESA
jgi:aspartate carbamoyltransferase catalytic subunit